MSSIKLVNLRKEFKEVVAVEELNLEFGNGEFAALLGPSGCGKSTTMNMISGLEQQTTGDIYFGDKLVNDVPPGERGVGFVFQNYAIFTHMSVADNIGFGLKVHKTPPEEIHRRVKDVATLLQLGNMLKQNAGRLSINDMQKVAIGRSMVMEPRIFLLDEPFSNLDASFRFYMRGELKRIQRETKQTMIYVTHDQVEAMSMADKIAVMDFGVLQQFGTPDEIYNYPNNTFVANFIGSPAMNFLDCEFKQEGDTGYLIQKNGASLIILDDRRRGLISQRSGAENLKVGIRPQHLVARSQQNGSSGWQGNTFFVEPLGSKTIVHVRVGGDDLQIVSPADHRPAIGENQWIDFSSDYVHVFDSETGQVIR
ncbi:MAG: ABC transporter ATP-binding protein [Caldilineales bacterium]|nr:ABC transporter ATP-binding protein [Caldilineales bacterium]